MLNQQKIFADRLARIASHSGNTNATLHIGGAEQLHQAALMRDFRGSRPAPLQGGFSALLLLVSLATGLVSWTWAHWARVSVLPGAEPLLALGADAAATLLFIFLLRMAFGFTGLATLAATLAGAACAMVTLHNAVHLWPHAFGLMFPPEWVASVLTTTQPLTVSLAALPI